MEKDGVALTGTVQLVQRGAATCRVLEANHPGEQYERIKENEGQPLNLWELDFAVHNGSGRPLNHLIALYGIESPWPPCTYWDGAAGVDWVNPAGHIQRTAEPVSVAAGETVTEQITLVAFHTDTPKFARWSVDYTFAATSAAQGTEDRRRAPGEDPDPTADSSPQVGITAEESCIGKPKGAACWKPLAGRPDCHVWRDGHNTDRTVGWSGGCAGGVAHGEGTLTSRGAYDISSSGRFERGKREGHWVVAMAAGERHVAQRHEGLYADGQRQGSWVIRFDDGGVFEGQYLDGERHGRWVERDADGDVREGPYVDSKRYGHWVERNADGTPRTEGPYVDGKKHGHWIEHGLVWRDSVYEGPYVDGKRHGRWVGRNADGTPRAEGAYVDGKRHGDWVERSGDQVSEGRYVDGKRHGHWVKHEADDNVYEGPYVEGKMHGHWVTQDLGGRHWDVQEGPYVKGERHGHWVIRGDNGYVEEGPYVEGNKHGRGLLRFSDGGVVEILYENGYVVMRERIR